MAASNTTSEFQPANPLAGGGLFKPKREPERFFLTHFIDQHSPRNRCALLLQALRARVGGGERGAEVVKKRRRSIENSYVALRDRETPPPPVKSL
ncbi:Hypothetical predicted protein [Podarcis lilfordi]|uniref:Uncharacterized protein n=1 Tax=Podarcis lilfordi TaxID=74358 RepID=A0AA35JSC3_9SAUR|nr:Hypothetical predicted protein [Podarcis lilfordi]